MRYFTLSELGATSEDDFHPGFLQSFDDLRHHINSSFYVTSCARSRVHNSKVGGTNKSFHIFDEPQHKGLKGCMAADVAMKTPSFRVEVVKTALLMGWSVGLNFKKQFIHLDRRGDVGQKQTIFSY